MQITTNFDSGSIHVVSADEPQHIALRLRSDTKSCNTQWFHFNLDTTAGEAHKMTILDAGKSTFPAGWTDYQAVASYDGLSWFRVATEYNGQNMVIEHTPERSRVSYAYFPPYSQSRQQQLLTSALESENCKQMTLGATPEQRPINVLVFDDRSIGDESDKKRVWIIARQHPGETMAQWFIEGLIERLLRKDATATQLLKTATFYIVANMNPDGSVLGNHRTNARGVNLNSVWHEPSKTDAPEVYHVREAMHAHGVDLFLDIHGDEEIPYSFMMGGISSQLLAEQAGEFKRDYQQQNTDFQLDYDYDTYPSAGGQSCCSTKCGARVGRTIATDYVESAFDCLSLLLEMPFRSADPSNVGEQIDPQEICKGLGNSVVDTILNILPVLSRSRQIETLSGRHEKQGYADDHTGSRSALTG